MRQHAIKRTILRDQRNGGLWSNTLCARNIVGGVTHKREHVNHLVGANAFGFPQRVGGQHRAVGGVKQRGLLIQNLRKVFVAAGNANLPIGVRSSHALHNCGDGIIGFHFWNCNNGNAKQFAQLNTARNLRTKIIRRRRAIGLVLRINLRAKCSLIARLVNDKNKSLWILLAQ